MPPPKLADEEYQRRYEAFLKYGSVKLAAEELGLNKDCIGRAKRWAVKKGLHQGESAIHEAARAGGIQNSDNLAHFWKIAKDEEGNGYSLFVKNPDAKGDDDEISLTDLVRESIQEGIEKRPKFEKRKHDSAGEHLLVIDLADVHFLKLCVETETGYTYNRDVARHRVIEGTKALLRKAKGHGIHRILFVMGNDILHVDNARSTTTSGTFQDSDGTIFQGYKDARMALTDAILQCAKVADVDLVHCMSNHDWIMGWTLSQTVSSILGSHPNINATDYNMSEAHRKYYRFGSNLIGLSHGDGAKEEKLYGVMVKEARSHISECKNLYWLLHHVHHKVRKKRGDNRPYLTEKDHNGMSVNIMGEPNIEGDQIDIEYVRSPSPPDSWHDRNGYVNRQAVECFIYHPYDGQTTRFTEWF
jgi:hypothetical protein